MVGSKVFIDLYHGRKDPDEDMKDWGTMGPVFEVDMCNFLYGNKIRLMKDNNIIGFLLVVDGLIYYDGVYYGEVSITGGDPTDADPMRIVPFDPEKANAKQVDAKE